MTSLVKTVADESTADETSPSSWRRLAMLLAALLVVAVAGVVVLWLERDDAGSGSASSGSSGSAGSSNDLLQVGIDAEAAAKVAVVRMTTYDWKTVDSDFAWVEDAGTDNFKSYFAGASADSKQVITTLRASAAGSVVDSAPKVLDQTHVTVLLFVDQEIRAAKQQGTKIDQPRVSMDMVLVDGQWLVEAVKIGDLLG